MELQRAINGTHGGGGGGLEEEQQRPPAMAGPGFRWLLVREGEGEGGGQQQQQQPARGGALSDGGRGMGDGSLPGTPVSGSARSVAASLDELLLNAPSAHSYALSAPALGLQSYGSSGGGAGSARADGAGDAARQQQQQWRSSGGAGLQSNASAAGLERLRAALKQKSGEARSLEARARELEATRDALAEELMAATCRADQVRCRAGRVLAGVGRGGGVLTGSLF